MNDSSLQSLPQSDIDSRVAGLQRQVTVLLMALLVVSVTLAAYLRYEDYIIHKDAAAIRPQSTQMKAAFDAASAGLNRQATTNFLAQLVAYSQKNPDFAQQVMKKYGFVPAPGAPAPTAPKK
jgi:hypothetical protein